jgi:predicted Zn-dependent protease
VLFRSAALAGGGGSHFDQRMPLARRAAHRALELAPDFADAHAAMSGILHFADRDYAGANREIDLALKLNPQSARAHDKRAAFRAIQGDLAGALSEASIAVALDPFNGELAYNVAWLLYCSRRYAEALETVEEFARRDPRALDSYMQNIHYHCYLRTSKINEAIEWTNERRRKGAATLTTDLELAYAYALADRRDEARKLVQSGPANERSYERGIVYMALSDLDTAFERLNRAIDEHSIWAEWFKVDPALDPIRSDPRFPKLLERMGLPR